MKLRERRQRQRLFDEQHGKCHWCQIKMVMPTEESRLNPPDNEATIDHLDSRWSRTRGQYRGEIRHVIACRRCNEERGQAEQAGIPRWMLWWLYGRVPVLQHTDG